MKWYDDGLNRYQRYRLRKAGKLESYARDKHHPSKDGLTRYQRYRKRHQDEILAREADYRDRNRERMRARDNSKNATRREQQRAATRRYYQNNTEKIKAKARARWANMSSEERAAATEHNAHYKRLRAFGISRERYEVMITEQGGGCAVCGCHPGKTPGNMQKRFLSVDHDHDTGKVRALLCDSCNICLGRLGEDPERIDALASYARWCHQLKAQGAQAMPGRPATRSRRLVD